MAPEIINLTTDQNINRNIVNPKSDIYSVGVVLHYLLFRKGVFVSNELHELYDLNK